MSRTTYVWRDGAIVEKHLAPPKSGAFYVISDNMDGAMHPCTGEMMDSKSNFRRTTRAHGCIEVGDQKFPARRDTYDANEMKRTIAEAMRNPDRRGDSDFMRPNSQGWNP